MKRIVSLVLLLAGCATLVPKLPVIAEAPTGSRENGRVVWHDLLTNTPDGSRRCYSELFGREFERPGIGVSKGYELIRHDGRLKGGTLAVATGSLGALFAMIQAREPTRVCRTQYKTAGCVTSFGPMT